MGDKIYLKDLGKILMGGVIIWKWNEGAGKHDVLFQTYAIEARAIPDKYLDMAVCGIGAYLDDYEMNYVSVELE